MAELVDSLVKMTGATVVATHHINKNAEALGILDANSATGSKQLVDYARVVLSLKNLSASEVKRLNRGVGEFVELCLTKANYSSTLGDPCVFERAEGGALVHAPPIDRDQFDALSAYVALEELYKSKKQPITREEHTTACKGLEPSMSERRAKSARARLVTEKRVVEVPLPRAEGFTRGPGKIGIVPAWANPGNSELGNPVSDEPSFA